MELFKIRVKNLGRIKEAALSIRPLTVFCGPNNTNKTWVANAIYGLARRLQMPVAGWVEHSDSSIDAVLFDSETANLIDQEASRFVALAKNLSEHTDLVDRIRAGEGRLRRTNPLRLRLESKGLAPLLFVDERDVPDAAVELTVNDEQRTTEHAARCPVAEELTLSYSNRISPSALFSARLDDAYIWPSELSGIDFDTLDRDFVRPAVADLFLGRLGKVVAFPAERKALTELCRDPQFRAEDLFSLSGVHFLKLLRLFARVRRFDPRFGSEPIAGILEERILDGRVVLEETPAGGRWVYQSNSGGRFEMPAASSLVRSLGGFDAYLRLFAAPGDLILIDEPEMNAHPDAQLVLAEILGLLVNSGVNVILTTHSPYIIDHINNLLGASNVPLQKQDELAKQFKLQRKEAFLKSADVAGYLFGEQGDVKLAFNAETQTIDWSTFGAVSEQVTNLYPEILSASGWE
jgi:hypothetical protein